MPELDYLDKEGLIQKLIAALPDIRQGLNISLEDMERATEIKKERIAAFEDGHQTPKWSEYLSIVFILWTNEKSRSLLDEKGLFPMELKKVFSINRNAHEAIT